MEDEVSHQNQLYALHKFQIMIIYLTFTNVFSMF